jgi:hypothetical protein
MIRDAATARRAEAALKAMKRVMDAGQADDALRERYWVGCEMLVAFELTENRLISDHTALEVAAAHWRGRRTGSPIPLDAGQPVPGCTCPDCTGVAADAPARQVVRPMRRQDTLPALDVDRARQVPILDVAARLGITHRNGWALCPFHEDGSPSLHLNASKNAAFCNPCGKSWDVIALVMELENKTFVDAVKELAA